MKDFESDKFALDHEEGMVILANGKEMKFMGKKGSVNFDIGNESIENAVTVHNHPNRGISNIGIVFSDTDVTSFAYGGDKEMRMITTDKSNGKKVVVRLIRNREYTKPKYKSDPVYQFYHKYEVYTKGQLRTARRKATSQEDYVNKLNGIIPKIEKKLTDLSNEYGYTYSKEYL